MIARAERRLSLTDKEFIQSFSVSVLNQDTCDGFSAEGPMDYADVHSKHASKRATDEDCRRANVDVKLAAGQPFLERTRRTTRRSPLD